MLTRCYDHREEDYSMSLKRINCYHYCQLGRKNYLHYFTQLYCFFQKLSPIDFPLWLTLNGLGSLGATTTAKNLQPPRLHLAFRACMMMPFPGDFRKDRKLPYVSYFSTFGISLLLVSTSSHPLMNQLTNKH